MQIPRGHQPQWQLHGELGTSELKHSIHDNKQPELVAVASKVLKKHSILFQAQRRRNTVLF